VNADEAFAGASAKSTGLSPQILSEMQTTVAPSQSTQTYGRGSGLELGLGTTVPAPPGPDPNQLVLAGLAEASAAPPNPTLDKQPVTKQITVPAAPVAYAALLSGSAAAVFDPNVCVIGQPLSFGDGFASDVRLIDTTGSSTNPPPSPLLSSPGNARSTSFTFLTPNGDGTWGVASETLQTVAPVHIGPPGMGVTITIAGPFGFLAVATGHPGTSKVTTLGNPLLTITPDTGPAPPPVKLSDVIGTNGIDIPLPMLGDVAVGEPARALVAPAGTPDPTKKPVIAADGTSASGAEDLVRVLLNPGGAVIADVRVAHVEAVANVPAGGLACTIPVSKVAQPMSVTAGQSFDWLITIPSAPLPWACDLINISAIDNVSVQSGSPKWTLNSADHGGSINGNTVTWSNLGNYHPGDPPIILDIHGTVPGDSGAGVILNTVNVSATLGKCTGGAAGTALTGFATAITGQAVLQAINGAAITGSASVQGPGVSGVAPSAALPRTGGHNPWLPWVAAGLIGSAIGILRYRRLTTA
jgi:LPXTG-motif cell wall-anchored protein